MADDNAQSCLTPLPTEKLPERPSFHLTESTDTGSLLYQLHITLTMYTGIPVDDMELYSYKWLILSKASERYRAAANIELPLAIKWLIMVFRANKASAYPCILFGAKLQLIGYKKVLTNFENNSFKEFGYYRNKGNSSVVIYIIYITSFNFQYLNSST